MAIESLVGAAIQVNLPIALWKLPGAKKINVAIDLSEKVFSTKIEFENKEKGFAFSPFINPNGKRTLFLHADLRFDPTSRELIENSRIKQDLEKQKRKNKLIEVFHHLIVHPDTNPLPWHDRIAPPKTQTAKAHYCKLVAKGVKAIRQKQFKKLVLSRSKVVSLPDDFNVVHIFQKLCAAYPNAFVSLISIPGIGTWMGASPEILVSIRRDHAFHTVSLAGTQRVGNKISPFKEPDWAQKELEEQAWVSRYIINCFKRIGLQEFKQEGPRTVAAGNLLHLKTDFTADMKKLQVLQLGSRMLKLLHPTPAVCGMPKGRALVYITDNEEYDRQFYTGFLGPVNVENESHVYVNLRCMQLYKKQAILYAGAGITSDSVPEKEWQETEMKCETLLRIMDGK